MAAPLPTADSEQRPPQRPTAAQGQFSQLCCRFYVWKRAVIILLDGPVAARRPWFCSCFGGNGGSLVLQMRVLALTLPPESHFERRGKMERSSEHFDDTGFVLFSPSCTTTVPR